MSIDEFQTTEDIITFIFSSAYPDSIPVTQNDLKNLLIAMATLLGYHAESFQLHDNRIQRQQDQAFIDGCSKNIQMLKDLTTFISFGSDKFNNPFLQLLGEFLTISMEDGILVDIRTQILGFLQQSAIKERKN
jgi:hypothetical protein